MEIASGRSIVAEVAVVGRGDRTNDGEGLRVPMRASPTLRVWSLAALMASVGAVGLVAIEFPERSSTMSLPWWVLVAAFALTEATVIHLPTRRSTHTISVSEIPFVIGLAFLNAPAFIAARLLGSALAYVVVNRQKALKLSFNASLLLFESVVSVTVYHAVLADALPVDPRGWVAASVAVAVSASLSGLLVSLAIAIYEGGSPLRDRSKELTAGLVISFGAGVVGVLWMMVLWQDRRAAVLLLATAIPVFISLKVYERLARRHDELDMAYELTKTLEERDTPAEVADAILHRVAEALVPAAAVVLLPDEDPAFYLADAAERVVVHLEWAEIMSQHPFSCEDGSACPCAGRILGPTWRDARSYMVTIGDSERGLLIVRPPESVGTEISAADHRMLEAIAAQISSALTRIAALRRLEREIEEKQALVRSKDQLIAAVSHELRTPLTGIVGFAELLAQDFGDLESVDLDYAKLAIASEAQDLSNIVEDLLTAARADLGSLEVHALPVSATACVERVLPRMRTGHEVRIVGADRVVSADAPRLRQILRNLLTNATRYGGDQIEVHIEGTTDEVTIRVRDDGLGVADARVDSIFEPYQSAHQDPSQPGSLGLGLTISRTLARLMGGDLTYTRIEGVTEFRLDLPAATRVEANEAAQTH